LQLPTGLDLGQESRSTTRPNERIGRVPLETKVRGGLCGVGIDDCQSDGEGAIEMHRGGVL
jgi:hypothetical protein